MLEKSKVLKVNGFSKGLNLHQIFSYVTLLIQILLFSFFIVPNFITPIKVLFSVLYYTSTALVIISGYKATVIDPTDEIVFLERRCRLEGKPFDETRYHYQCDFCQTSVNDNSKHCRTCDRCVNDFDHHCNWVNNCISKKNYKAFFIATASLAFSSCLFLVLGLLFMIDYYTSSINLVNDITVIKGDPSEHWKPIIMGIFAGIAAVFFMLLFKLIIFHIYLLKNKLSTYDYILKQREIANRKKNAKRIQQSKLREKRVTPTSSQNLKNVENINRERKEAPKVKSEPEESDSSSDSESSQDSIEPQSSERPVLPQIQTSIQSGLNSQREFKALIRRETTQNVKEIQGADTERLEKLMRASSCTDIDLEQNASDLGSPENKLSRKRKSELPPVTLEALKLDRNSHRNLGLKEVVVLSPFDGLRNHQDTSTEGPLSFSSRTLSVTWSGQNQRLLRHFSSPKQEHYEYGNFIKTESNTTTPKQFDLGGDRKRLKPKSIVEFEKLDLNPKRLASSGLTEVTSSRDQDL